MSVSSVVEQATAVTAPQFGGFERGEGGGLPGDLLVVVIVIITLFITNIFMNIGY